ncbi:MAG TPA: hypothetical protein VFM58_19490 [Solirubrobacteraceae bacterium]|nr:hypothetical protein [Solirubrobacteraceae bacterium]
MTVAKAFAACAATFMVMAMPASAEEPLLGSDGKGRVRVLDPDLHIVPGTPALPKATDATVLSPDGRRFASWSFHGRRLTVRSRRTFRPIARLPIETGADAYWPARDHVMTAVYRPWLERPAVIRAFDLRHGTSRTLRLCGLPLETERVGRLLRVLTVGGPDFCCRTGPFVVTDIGAAGVVKRRWRVPLPAGFTAGAGMRLSRNLLLATQGRRQALIRVHRGTTKRLDLPRGFYDWVGRRFLHDGRHLARVDRRALSVSAAVDTGVEATATPFAGGVVVGFGRARYDAGLRRVAENPAPAPTQGFGPLLAGGRLYDLVVDCDDSDRTRAAIADATTGAAVAERRGRWKFGVLGGGEFDQAYADDVCD